VVRQQDSHDYRDKATGIPGDRAGPVIKVCGVADESDCAAQAMA